MWYCSPHRNILHTVQRPAITQKRKPGVTWHNVRYLCFCFSCQKYCTIIWVKGSHSWVCVTHPHPSQLSLNCAATEIGLSLLPQLVCAWPQPWDIKNTDVMKHWQELMCKIYQLPHTLLYGNILTNVPYSYTWTKVYQPNLFPVVAHQTQQVSFRNMFVIKSVSQWFRSKHHLSQSKKVTG